MVVGRCARCGARHETVVLRLGGSFIGGSLSGRRGLVGNWG